MRCLRTPSQLFANSIDSHIGRLIGLLRPRSSQIAERHRGPLRLPRPPRDASPAAPLHDGLSSRAPRRRRRESTPVYGRDRKRCLLRAGERRRRGHCLADAAPVHQGHRLCRFVWSAQMPRHGRTSILVAKAVGVFHGDPCRCPSIETATQF